VNSLGQVAGWLALFAAAWNTGLFTARWNDPRRPPRTGLGQLSLFAGAVFVAIAWALLGGALLRRDTGLAVIDRWLKIDAHASARLATIFVAPEGAILTVALIMAFAALLQSGSDQPDPRLTGRRLVLASGMVMLLLTIATVRSRPFEPATTIMGVSRSVPAHLLHPGAALHALFLVASLGVGAVALMSIVATRSVGGRSPRDDTFVRRSVAGAWVLATLSLGADQWARMALDATPGASGARNAAGIVWWLVLGAMFHPFVRSSVLGRMATPSATGRLVRRSAYVGALMIVFAFGAHVLAARADVTLDPGRTTDVRDAFGRRWHLVHQGLSRFDAEDHDATALAIDVTAPNSSARLMTAELRDYRDARGDPAGASVSVRAVHQGVFQELLLTLQSADETERAKVRVAFVPLASLWVPGLLLLVVGATTELARGSASVRRLGAISEREDRGEEVASLIRGSPLSCPTCGVRPEPDACYCSNCGRFLPPCPGCGRLSEEVAPRFCVACGAALA
jgi:hypothetical protein